jgi:hypothetical protein
MGFQRRAMISSSAIIKSALTNQLVQYTTVCILGLFHVSRTARRLVRVALLSTLEKDFRHPVLRVLVFSL